MRGVPTAQSLVQWPKWARAAGSRLCGRPFLGPGGFSPRGKGAARGGHEWGLLSWASAGQGLSTLVGYHSFHMSRKAVTPVLLASSGGAWPCFCWKTHPLAIVPNPWPQVTPSLHLPLDSPGFSLYTPPLRHPPTGLPAALPASLTLNSFPQSSPSYP